MNVLGIDRPHQPGDGGRAVARRFLARPSRRLATFAGVVLALEAATVLAGLGRDVTPFVLVLIPPVAALLVSAIGGGTVAVRSLFGRMGRWRVRWPWYLAAIGIPVIEKLLVDLAGLVSGATTPDRLVGALPVSALIVPLVVLVPALLEEFGWRGFGVQTAVDAGRSPAWAAAVVGVVFVLLHVPLYLPGQIYDGLPWWPLPIILLAGTVLLTWIYLRTGSALLAGLMHASLNATVPLTWGLDPAWVWQARAVVLTVIVIVLISVTGKRWWLASFAVGGHRLHLNCVGEGSPTVIMEGGSGGNVLHWMTVQPLIGQFTRVCAYDRAGMGWSEPGPLPRTPDRIVAELHTLLVNAGVPGPYVLVGHSLGGKYVRLYADEYPQEVAGMVLVDSRHEHVDAAMSPEMRADDSNNAQTQHRIAWVLGRLGIVRLLAPGSADMPIDTRRMVDVLAYRPQALTTQADEYAHQADADAALHAASPLGPLPLVVLSSELAAERDPTLRAIMRTQAGLSTDSQLVIVTGSGHAIQFDRPDLVINEVLRVVGAGAPP